MLIAACFLAPLEPAPPGVGLLTASRPHLMSVAIVLAAAPAIRAVLTAYDGWYAPIYLAEENIDPATALPRSIIGGALMVMALYLLINLALLHVLPITVLAASNLPAAAAAQIVLPRGGALFVTVVSALTVLSLINSNTLTTPRIMFSLARDGWIPHRLADVSTRGTPRVALATTMFASAAMILSGTFNQIIALFAVLILLYYVSAFLAVIVLRFRMPDAPRPYKAFAYPVSTLIVLLGSVGFLVVTLVEDKRTGIVAALFLGACSPAYLLARRINRASNRVV